MGLASARLRNTSVESQVFGVHKILYSHEIIRIAWRSKVFFLLNYYTIATISHQDSANNETCPIRCEESDDFSNLFWLSCASNRSAFAMFTQEFASIWINLIEEICYDIARSNRVNTDAMSDIFNRQRSGQLRNGPFGGRIGCNLRKCVEAGEDILIGINSIYLSDKHISDLP